VTLIFIILVCGAFSQQIDADKIMDELKTREEHYKEMKSKTKDPLELFRINHILREIKRKKTSIVLYKRIEEDMKRSKSAMEEMSEKIKSYKVCTNQEERDRLKDMKDTFFRQSVKIKKMEEESNELVNNIREPSFVETVSEISEKKIKEIHEERERINKEMIITKSDIAQIQTNIKEQESKIIKTGVEALRKFFEDEKRDMIYILQKKVTKMHQLYEAKKDGIENEKKIKEELKNKVEGQEEREYVDTLNKLKRNRKALKEEIRENEEKKKEIFEALKWQNITDLKRGKMMEQLRIDEMRENHMRRDIIDLERRITSLIRERED